jgi:hypothetical protein
MNDDGTYEYDAEIPEDAREFYIPLVHEVWELYRDATGYAHATADDFLEYGYWSDDHVDYLNAAQGLIRVLGPMITCDSPMLAAAHLMTKINNLPNIGEIEGNMTYAEIIELGDAAPRLVVEYSIRDMDPEFYDFLMDAQTCDFVNGTLKTLADKGW